MNPDVAEMLAAVLARLDGIQSKLERVTMAVDEATDAAEAARISLTALRDAVKN